MHHTFSSALLLAAMTFGCDRNNASNNGGQSPEPSAPAPAPASNLPCHTDPQGEVCQNCLATARTACVNRGVCQSEYGSLEYCATQSCVDANGQPTTGCCDSRAQLLTACLNSSCSDWSACFGR